jgi:hypothetical protein
MARHNREGHGSDQRGFDYAISYQPDWLKVIKVTRTLESGRQSSKTLFRNPAQRAQEEPGPRVRTRVMSPEQDLDFEITIDDPNHRVKRVRVTCHAPAGKGGGTGGTLLRSAMEEGDDEIEFTIEDTLPPP